MAIEITWKRRYRPWLCAAEPGESRYALDCVSITPSGLMVATEARMLSITPATILGVPDQWPGALVPAKWLAWAAEQQDALCGLSYTLTVDVVERVISAPTRRGWAGVELVPLARYPQWHKPVVKALNDALNAEAAPSEGRRPPLSLDPVLAHTLCCAIGLSDPDGHCGQAIRFIPGPAPLSPILIPGWDPQAFGVLMPMDATTADHEPDLAALLQAVERHREPAQEVTP